MRKLVDSIRVGNNIFGIGSTYITEEVSKLLNTKQDTIDLDNKLDYELIANVPEKLSDFTNDLNFLTEHQSLSAYSTTEEVESKINTATSGLAKTSDIPTKVSELENDKNYLTKHQSLTEYAKKVDIPTKVSQLANDRNYTTMADVEAKGYLTEHQSLSGYATEEWVESKGYLTEHQSLENYSTKEDLNTEISTRSDADDALSERLNQVETTAKAQTKDITSIKSFIPEAATDTNKLADKDWVNSSIASNTATFRGTFETVADLPVADIKKNDYAFIIAEDASGDPEYQRYKYDGESWVFEYTLNNSSFTSDQWKSVNSGITADLVAQITTNKDGIAALNTSLSDEVERATTKEAELENEIAAKYTKPDDGIPASDLTSAVQTVLTNATTAYGWGNHAKAGYLPFNQSYIADTKSWITTGYVKTRPGTLNLPEVCTGQDRWGVLFFASENGANGTYLYWPIDGTYKGRMFTRTQANGTYSAWYLIAQTNDIPTKLSELTDDVVAGNYISIADKDSFVTLADEQIITGKKYTTQVLSYAYPVDSNLPDGYKAAVLNLNSVSIDTGVQVSSLTLPTIEADIQFDNTEDCDFFGTQDNSSATILFNIVPKAGTNYTRWGTTKSVGPSSWPVVLNTFNNIKIQSTSTNSHLYYCNGNLLTTSNHTAQFTNTGTIFIGRGRTVTQSSWKTFKIWNEDTLVFGGIACYELASESYGFYDIVSGTFKTVTGATGHTDVDYALKSDIPVKISQFTNDAGYITSSGSVKHATSADTADTATNATNDSEGNKISATYATKSALEEAIESAGKVDDVQVNGTSVVTDKVAKIDLSNYYTKDESYSNTEIDTKLLDKANDKVTYKNVVDDKEVETTDTVSNWITNIVSSINSMGTGFEEVAKSVNTINTKISAAATAENQLADKDWVNSSIASNTATFRGTFETVDNLPTGNVKDNDYAFIIAADDSGNPEYQRYKYSNGAWTFEYTLNNSSFTSDQWKAINSGITSDTLGTLVNATTLSDELAKYLPLTGGTLTGLLNAPKVETGTGGDSYFQSQKFRGQGNASEYWHAIDFGYSGHDQVDFYEYGGKYNFWQNQSATKPTDESNIIASLQRGKLVEQGNTLTYPGKSGTIALTSDIPTVPTKLSEFTDDVVSGNYLPIDGTAVKATADASGNVITDTYATKTELIEVITDAEKVEEATAGILYGINERLDVITEAITDVSLGDIESSIDDEFNTTLTLTDEQAAAFQNPEVNCYITIGANDTSVILSYKMYLQPTTVYNGKVTMRGTFYTSSFQSIVTAMYAPDAGMESMQVSIISFGKISENDINTICV